MQNQVISSVFEHSSRQIPDTTNVLEPQAPVIGLPLAPNSYHEARVELDFDIKGLREFCDQHSLETHNVFQTAWAIVVSCYAGIEDVSFAYGTNNGGCSFSKPGQSYVCHAHIDSESRLLDTLLVASKNADNILNHDGFPIEECPNESPDKATSFFSSKLYVSDYLGELSDREMHDESLSKYHVFVQLIDKKNASLSVLLRAHASRFSATHMKNMAHTLGKTLHEIIKADSQSLIADLDICSHHDLEKILSWNQPMSDPVESCFHWHFETVARRTPNATAICSWDRSFTYQELDNISTKLANNLHHAGVMPETFVGICFSKSSMAYVCMLSIFKAGGAFVAIDPSYPPSRIRTIVEATKASIFMTDPAHCHLFDEFAKHTIAIDAKLVDELPVRPSSPGSQSKPSDVAYAVFTSGSTGSPKGIMIEHCSLCNAALNLAAPMHIDSSSRVLQFAAYTFDVSYGDTFVTLAHGGCICVPSENERINDISGAMVRMNVNNACLIPSVARMLRPENVPGLRVLNLGAEALLKDNIDIWAEKVTLSVVYGPSECTVWCAAQTGVKADSLPNIIGRGVGTLLWVANATNHDRLCPIGCIGELLIEGPGLARGYLDAEQTRNAFIENPSWARTKPSQRRRFYKTGDLVRYQSDGTLSFIGRKDTQIKLHGRRIELGEIEYHLSCHELLRQSIVLLPSAGKHRQKLVAIVVFKTSIASDTSSTELKPLTGAAMQKSASELADVKAFLSSRLPSYMLPQEWIAVENIPLMISGKMNRLLSKRFVESFTEEAHRDSSDAFLPSHNQDTLMIDRLRQLWSEVLELNIEDVGINDGFVSLGGDSFSAMDLVARCKAEGYSFTVADLLSDSTLRQMADKVGAASSMAAGSTREGIRFSQDQHKFAAPRPLVLRPVWWDVDGPSVAVS